MVAIMALVMLGVGASVVHADPVNCLPGAEPSPRTGQCTVVAEGPGTPGVGLGNDAGDGSGAGGDGAENVGSTAPEKCVWVEEIPCVDERGYWSNEMLCYITPDPMYAAGSLPPDDPIWDGNYPEGAIYLCYNPWLEGMAGYSFWAAAPPAGPAAPPDPRELAQQAIEQMNLRAVNIGIVPEARPGSVGLVGMPNWMWVENPTENTWGPATRTASAGGWTVTATAEVSQVRWDMGDGQVVVCEGAGTPYQDSFGKASSPTCGHTYTRQGDYTVRASSHWVITWVGIGQTGTIGMDLTQTADLTIGEVQVLRQ
jgi:hypothetical protein